jgi:hypothetical protein
MKSLLHPEGLIVLACALAVGPLLAAAAESDSQKPVLLYSRYFNAEGENRYLPDGTYSDVLQRLRAEFDVRIHGQPLTARSLSGVKVVLVANPSDKAIGSNPAPHHFAAKDIQALSEFVNKGGGLIILGNQENHNLEIEDTNKLLSRFGIQFTNVYTDAKALVLPKDAAVLGGLRWAYYTGNSLLLDARHAAKPRALVANDLTVKPVGGPRDHPGALMAASEPGQGRVVVVTDAGWISNDALAGKGVGNVAIKEQDNWEIFRRLTRWTARMK